MSGKRKIRRRYSEDFLKHGFIAAKHDEWSPFCLLCQTSLTNESMRRGRLETHLRVKHPNHALFRIDFFRSLKERNEQAPTIARLFSSASSSNSRIHEASYELSLLIAKLGKSHCIGEQLVKPATSLFLSTVLRVDDKDLRALPLSKNTVGRRIDEMAKDVETQLIGRLTQVKFSLQLDESTIRDSEALHLAYVRYIDDADLKEEMLFCESLKTTTRAVDIFGLVREYLSGNEIPFENIVSCTADGAPATMGKKS
ncbi:zinc finger BED domain-containing protein 5-like, partial [Galendromus occidentalis]|uniref:Zinc finger BED domain-containing protein 5-like n=1 Tax=Galendromus occidentalis TaxID=34638 RepID=A0AAJ6VXH3_9ACAR